MLTKQTLIEQSGVNRATIYRMIQKGILEYADTERKLFDDDALKIVQCNYHAGKRRTVSKRNTCSVLPSPATIIISRSDFDTFLLHAEKVSNGQKDFASVLRREFHDKLNVDADMFIDDLTKNPEGDIHNRTRLFLEQFPFIIQDADATYKLCRRGDFCELDLVPDKAAQVVMLEPDVVKPQAEENATLERRAERIRKLSADAQIRLVAIGFELIAAKKQIGHGGWTEWLRSEFDWSDRTARYFMAVAERFGNRNTYSILPPSTLKAMLALPVGEEDDFIATQVELGRPIESQSARQVQQSVKEWNKRAESPSDASNTPDTIKTSTDTQKPLETPHKPPISLSTGNTEWYTPPVYIDAARAVLGDIDLDPASCELANQTVNAKNFFSAETDGLCHEWHGRIWLNPPFKSGLIERFVDKLLGSNFDAAIVLTDNATDTRWFCKLATAADAILFTTGRINFLKSDGSQEVGNHVRGQAFFYFGDRADLFADIFGRFGWLAKSFSLKEKNHVDV